MLWFVCLTFPLLQINALLLFPNFFLHLPASLGHELVGGVANVSACPFFLNCFYLSLELYLPVQVPLHGSEALCYETVFSSAYAWLFLCRNGAIFYDLGDSVNGFFLAYQTKQISLLFQLLLGARVLI